MDRDDRVDFIIAPSFSGKTYASERGHILDGDSTIAALYGWPSSEKWPSYRGGPWWKNPYLAGQTGAVVAALHWLWFNLPPRCYPSKNWTHIHLLVDGPLPPVAVATSQPSAPVPRSLKGVLWLPNGEDDCAALLLERRARGRDRDGELDKRPDSLDSIRGELAYYREYADRFDLPVATAADYLQSFPRFNLEKLTTQRVPL